ncbi:MAG: hypothetical protein GX220_04245 [Treponema sp.]|nr:hypothetical protein [Treponema sp.]
MNNIFAGEILVLVLLLVTEMRPFFLKNITYNHETDVLSILSLVALLLSILLILVFGIYFSLLVLFLLSLFVFLANIKAFFSVCFSLHRSNFSVFFIIISVLQFLLTVGFLILLIIYSPLIEKNKTQVTVLTEVFSGDRFQGFLETKNTFKKNSIKVTKFNPNTEKILGQIFFIPDIYTNAQDNAFSLKALCQKGYEVIVVENSKFMPFKMRLKYRYNKNYSEENYEILQKIIIEQIKNALALLKPSDKVFVLTDGKLYDAWENLDINYKNLLHGIYKINETEQIYNYDAGFGNLVLINPLECAFININITKDKLVPEIIASKAHKYFASFVETAE